MKQLDRIVDGPLTDFKIVLKGFGRICEALVEGLLKEF